MVTYHLQHSLCKELGMVMREVGGGKSVGGKLVRGGGEGT